MPNLERKSHRQPFLSEKERHKTPETEQTLPFASVTIIGAAGQTGQFFAETLGAIPDGPRINAVIRDPLQADKLAQKLPSVNIYPKIETTLNTHSDVLILATANPTEEVLNTIADQAKGPLTLILPQNGVDVIPAARKAFAGKEDIHLIRASLFTPVSMSEDRTVQYDSRKKRIAFAPVYADQNAAFSNEENQSLQKTIAEFKQAGYDVIKCNDYRSMEWTKLVANGLGSTAAVTGIGPRETFKDSELFALEIQALKARVKILKAAGIPFTDIPWVSPLKKMAYAPNSFLSNIQIRNFIAEQVAKDRNNEPPATARKIVAGNKQIEATTYYHEPFIKLASLHGLRSPVDEAIQSVLTEHQDGKINLSNPSLSSETKKNLLLEKFHIKIQEPLSPRNPLTTKTVERLARLFTKETHVSGIKNLETVRENLKNGKSSIFLANHLSHADHPTLALALKDNGCKDLAERMIFVAGVRLQNESVGKQFNDAYPRITVKAPTPQETKEEKEQAQAINRKGIREINKILDKGNLLVIYPEGTRSRTKQMQEAIPAVAIYVKHENVASLIPIGIHGTEQLLPPGKTRPRFAETNIAFGQPISPKTIITAAEGASHAEKNKKIIASVMLEIAKLLPKEYRGVYK